MAEENKENKERDKFVSDYFHINDCNSWSSDLEKKAYLEIIKSEKLYPKLFQFHKIETEFNVRYAHWMYRTFDELHPHYDENHFKWVYENSQFWDSLKNISSDVFCIPSFFLHSKELIENISKGNRDFEKIVSYLGIKTWSNYVITRSSNLQHIEFLIKTLKVYSRNIDESNLLIPSILVEIDFIINNEFGIDEKGVGKEIKRKLSMMSKFYDFLEKELMKEDEKDYLSIVLFKFYQASVQNFFESLNSNFSNKKSELNRNWILHGKRDIFEYKPQDFFVVFAYLLLLIEFSFVRSILKDGLSDYLQENQKTAYENFIQSDKEILKMTEEERKVLFGIKESVVK